MITTLRNPNNPKRKIKHAKLMLEAGFTINMGWYRDEPASTRNSDCDALIYWKRGDVNLTYFDYQEITLNKLVKDIIKQTEYQVKRKAQVVFVKEVDCE